MYKYFVSTQSSSPRKKNAYLSQILANARVCFYQLALALTFRSHVYSQLIKLIGKITKARNCGFMRVFSYEYIPHRINVTRPCFISNLRRIQTKGLFCCTS